MVELLLKRGANVNARTYSLGSALGTAVKQNFQGVAELLLQYKADPNIPDNDQNQIHTPLYWAAQNGRLPLVKLLVAHGADVNAKNQGDQTALHVAASRSNLEIVRLLIDSKADIAAKTSSGSTPLHSAAAGNEPESIKLLLARGAELNTLAQQDRDTPLSYAVKNNARQAAQALLQAKADPNLSQPLMEAVSSSRVEMVQLLVTNGANPNLKSSGGRTPLAWAIESLTPSRLDRAMQGSANQRVRQQVEIVSALLKAKADPNLKNNARERADWTALHYAAEKSSPEILELLLKNGADPNARAGYSPSVPSPVRPPANEAPRDLTGATPLYLAALRNEPEIVQLLLKYKADPNLRKTDGNVAPLAVAISNTNAEIAQLLLQQGADGKGRGPNDETYLQQAVRMGSKPMVELLLAQPCDVNAINRAGYTALDLTRGDPAKLEIAELLRKHGALTDVPHFDRIEVSRASAQHRVPVFQRGTNDWNQHSLLEVVAWQYRLLQVAPAGIWKEQQTFAGVFWDKNKCRFPDLRNVLVRRAQPDGKGWGTITYDLTKILQTGDRSADPILKWGDVVEIPEIDHPVNEEWDGMAKPEVDALLKCISREIRLAIKGTNATLTLTPSYVLPGGGLPRGVNEIDPTILYTPASYVLRSVLDNSKMVRASSDLSRVKVTRRDSSGRQMEWVLNCSGTNAPDLWIQNRDRIEVPEK
jgi:ankyrin repeat protein